MRSKTSLRRLEQTRKLTEMLGGKCSRCGYDRNLAGLDFHHIDPATKDGPVGWFVNFHRFEDAVAEAKKCILLCRTCHVEVHNPDLALENNDGEVSFVNKELKKLQKSCDTCGQYSGGKPHCSQKCANVAKRKVRDRPTKKELKSLIKSMSLCKIGRKYGVSDNAVRKWAKQYELL